MGIIGFIYGVASYLAGVVVLVYAMGFVGNFWVPKSIDSGVPGPLPEALIVDLALLALFAVQHSVMARPGFKEFWTRIVPKSVERSTFVLFSSLVLMLLYWKWQPLAGTVWSVENAAGRSVLQALYWAGWAVLLGATFMINHFDLFGLRQVYLRLKDQPYTQLPFAKFAFYRFIRHPIMLGFLISFWATPLMSLGHLLFAGATTAYIFIGIFLEERDLRRAHGEAYEQYRREAGMVLPRLRR